MNITWLSGWLRGSELKITDSNGQILTTEIVSVCSIQREWWIARRGDAGTQIKVGRKYKIISVGVGTGFSVNFKDDDHWFLY